MADSVARVCMLVATKREKLLVRCKTGTALEATSLSRLEGLGLAPRGRTWLYTFPASSADTRDRSHLRSELEPSLRELRLPAGSARRGQCAGACHGIGSSPPSRPGPSSGLQPPTRRGTGSS